MGPCSGTAETGCPSCSVHDNEEIATEQGGRIWDKPTSADSSQNPGHSDERLQTSQATQRGGRSPRPVASRPIDWSLPPNANRSSRHNKPTKHQPQPTAGGKRAAGCGRQAGRRRRGAGGGGQNPYTPTTTRELPARASTFTPPREGWGVGGGAGGSGLSQWRVVLVDLGWLKGVACQGPVGCTPV